MAEIILERIRTFGVEEDIEPLHVSYMEFPEGLPSEGDTIKVRHDIVPEDSNNKFLRDRAAGAYTYRVRCKEFAEDGTCETIFVREGK